MNLENRINEIALITINIINSIYKDYYNRIINIKSRLALLWDEWNVKYLNECYDLLLYYLDTDNFKFSSFFDDVNIVFEKNEKFFNSESNNNLDQIYLEIKNIFLWICEIIINETKNYQDRIPLVINRENEAEDKVTDRKDLQEIENLMDSI